MDISELFTKDSNVKGTGGHTLKLEKQRCIRRSVPTSMYQTLIVALVLSRLDYRNAVLVGLPAYLYNRLQSVLNAAARSIAGLRRSDHITDRHTRQFPPVERPAACSVQAGDNRLSLTERHGTTLPGCRPTTFVRYAF